jgi:hypothetical protein
MRQSMQRPQRFGAIVLKTTLLGALLCSHSGVGAEEREESKRYQLRWVREGGAESCVSGAALERLLEQVLEVNAVKPGRAVRIEGVATTAAEPLRYSIHLSVRDAATGEVMGERELSTGEPKCSALTPALLLVLAMSVDPDAGKTGLPPAVNEELRRGREEDVDVWPTPGARSVSRATPAALPTEQARPLALEQMPASRAATPGDARHALERSRAHESEDVTPDDPRVFGALALSLGAFPSLASGAELGARVALRRGWALSFSVLGWFPQLVELPPSPYLEDEGVQLAAGQVGAALCRPLLGARLQLGVCGGIGAGLRWVSALALGSRNNPTRPFYGPTLGVDTTFRAAGSWFLTGGVTAQAFVPRDKFTYVDHFGQARTWFEPALLSGRAWLGVGAFL